MNICNGSITRSAPHIKIKTLDLCHPCYNHEAASTHGRIHLPVAPRCNLGCNYCFRRFDCLNESRPGVSSRILTPEAAVNVYEQSRQRLKNLSVVGIAGPGDALANWPECRRTFELIRAVDPDVVFCLSTNGLKLSDLAVELAELNIRHITVTINSLKPQTISALYSHLNYHGKRYSGYEGAHLLIGNQLEGLRLMVEAGAVVKVNSVFISGINDQDILEVHKTAAEMGAYIGNIIPFMPVQGSRLQDWPAADPVRLQRIRLHCADYLLQMTHCGQCRADAAGLLGQEEHMDYQIIPAAG